MKPKFEQFLEENKGNFPLVEPPVGHRERFEAKLNSPKSKGLSRRGYLNIAATVTLLLGISALLYFNQPVKSVSPQTDVADNYKPEDLKESEAAIATVVEGQKQEILLENNENKELVGSTLEELQNLEKEYKQMEKDLMMSGNEKVIEAMHQNLELRTEILARTQEVLNKKEGK